MTGVEAGLDDHAGGGGEQEDGHAHGGGGDAGHGVAALVVVLHVVPFCGDGTYITLTHS